MDFELTVTQRERSRWPRPRRCSARTGRIITDYLDEAVATPDKHIEGIS